MPIGVLTDIHGNSVALDAVIEDARSADVDRWWMLGDLVAMGPDPVGTLDRLRSLGPEVRILGNTERYVLCDELPFPPTDELELTAELVDQMVEIAASLAWTRAPWTTTPSHGSTARRAITGSRSPTEPESSQCTPVHIAMTGRV